MMKRTFRLTALILSAAAFLTACGNTYSGVRIGNNGETAEAIRQGLKEHSSRITIRYSARTLDKAAIRENTRKLYEDALYESEDPKGGDYIRFQSGGYELRYSVSENRGKYLYEVSIIPDYYTTLKQEEYVDGRVKEIAEELKLSGLTWDKKAEKIYRYVYDNVEYDLVHKDKENKHLKTTAYAALYYHEAVCQGYSVLMYRLLKEAGLDARIETGFIDNGDREEYHAWNSINTGKKVFYMDVTMDKALGIEGESILRSDDEYFEKYRVRKI